MDWFNVIASYGGHIAGPLGACAAASIVLALATLFRSLMVAPKSVTNRSRLLFLTTVWLISLVVTYYTIWAVDSLVFSGRLHLDPKDLHTEQRTFVVSCGQMLAVLFVANTLITVAVLLTPSRSMPPGRP